MEFTLADGRMVFVDNVSEFNSIQEKYKSAAVKIDGISSAIWGMTEDQIQKEIRRINKIPGTFITRQQLYNYRNNKQAMTEIQIGVEINGQHEEFLILQAYKNGEKDTVLPGNVTPYIAYHLTEPGQDMIVVTIDYQKFLNTLVPPAIGVFVKYSKYYEKGGDVGQNYLYKIGPNGNYEKIYVGQYFVLDQYTVIRIQSGNKSDPFEWRKILYTFEVVTQIPV